MVTSGITPLAEPGSAHYIQLALTLALLVGLIRLAMGLLRLGFLVSLSQPTLSGYTSAAALIIGLPGSSTCWLVDAQHRAVLNDYCVHRTASRSIETGYPSN
jgi:MFS superfamily sulfate permease-like transporter